MEKEVIREFIFNCNEEAPSCHASTVLPVDVDTVLAAWFAGAREGKDDVGIWFAKRINGTWSKPKRVSPEIGIPHWNPVLFMGTDGTVSLFYKIGKKIPYWQTKIIRTKDLGETWTEPEFLIENDTTGGRGPVKNKCIRISDGTVLAPASTEQHKQWRPFIDISRDDGITWEKQKYIVRPRTASGLVGMIQPTLWESDNGHIHALMRSDKGKIYRSDSDDYGRTWCRAYATSLPNNNSGIDLVKAENSIYLVYNPVNENWGIRSPITLARSDDNGMTWTKVADLDKDGKEFSYPAITYFNSSLYITYTYERQNVRFIKIDI